ncbi:MAG: histidine phosphatase family protein [Actinobacteria bacterium]|nr:histidine phosphatase family protein [Actinomycetota bacterium]
MLPVASEVVVLRHGATEWSANGRHTSHTDLPLTPEGRLETEQLRGRIADREFALVLTSPLRRARDTAAICGLGEQAAVDELLREWDYGEYEGVTTVEIRKTIPGWTVWSGSCPGGESADDVSRRADAVIARTDEIDGAVAVFSHGHFSRVLVARWLGLPAIDGRLFAMHTATVNVLGYEREQRVLSTLNG